MGCGRLGGISSTVSAQETLALRGYDTAALVLLGDGLGNAAALRRHFGAGLPVLSLPECPPPPAPSRRYFMPPSRVMLFGPHPYMLNQPSGAQAGMCTSPAQGSLA